MGALQDRYHVGHNPPGYLTEQEPVCFDEWRPAAGYLMTLMREYADADDEATALAFSPETTGYATDLDHLASETHPRMRARVEVILTDNPPSECDLYAAWVEDGAGRRIAFWLMKVLCLGDDVA